MSLIVFCIFLAYCFCRRANKVPLSNGSSTNQINSNTKLRMSNGSGSTLGMKNAQKNVQPSRHTNAKTNASSKSSITSSNHNNEMNPFMQQKIQQTNDAYGYVVPPAFMQQQIYYQQQQQPQQVPLLQQYHHQQMATKQSTLNSQSDIGVKQYTANNIRLLQEIGKGNQCV